MRWTTITEDDLKAAGHGTLIDRARDQAVGDVDPVPEDIANAIARVRRAVSAGNPLDSDATKVPGSLKDVTVRRALFALMRRIRFPLSEDDRKIREEDSQDLQQLAEKKVLVEAPDDTDATLAPQNRGSWNSENKIIGRMHPVPAPGRQVPPGIGYANEDAVEDAE